MCKATVWIVLLGISLAGRRHGGETRPEDRRHWDHRAVSDEKALDAVNGLRMQINADHYRQPVHPLLIADLIDNYVQTEALAKRRLAFSRDATYVQVFHFMKKWIQPHWGKMGLGAVGSGNSVLYERLPFSIGCEG